MTRCGQPILGGRDDIMQYTKMCLICQQDKVEKAKVVGLLKPLLVPTRPWKSVFMEFITHLPKLFFKHVVKLWGVPTSIVSDHNGRFIDTFWTELFTFFENKLEHILKLPSLD
ncbi:reverse transcriptase [Cucumis melo var. makuwa]|uniref:Reverse transcriptase n=1 Tax=Cucumis melo var. makuwa TaxID=1194695 RepID=A0A5A7T1A7_CUCMM|nr:reverse transcriptase [Cucumis melo var. makuwa]